MVGNGVGNSGWLVNHLDIAPPYAGLLMGISNTFGTVPGFVAPQVTDMITTADPLTQPGLLKQQWRLVFQITAVISGFGAVFFAVFARGDRQSWAGGAE
jgi:ACS family sodium-dependent inorganic phosphate cotransporter-like MFS transporter 5